MKKRLFNGYSLVELAIVIIIIGIIIGGITAGGSIVRASKGASVISELVYHKDGYNKFKDIYGYIPGDMPPSVACKTFGSTPAGLNCSGSLSTAGNNLMDDDASNFYENTLAIYQLYSAKLTSFSPTAAYTAVSNVAGESFPLSKVYQKEMAGWAYIGMVTPESNLNFLNVIRLGGGGPALTSNANEILNGPVVPIAIIADIDRKIDEPNSPLRGRFFTTGWGCYSGTTTTATYPSENSTASCTANYADVDSSYTSANQL